MTEILQKELLEFEEHISKIIESQEPLCNKILENVRSIVSEVDPDLEVKTH